MHAGKELPTLGRAHGNPHDGFIPDRRRFRGPLDIASGRPEPAAHARTTWKSARRQGRSAIASAVTWPPIRFLSRPSAAAAALPAGEHLGLMGRKAPN